MYYFKKGNNIYEYKSLKELYVCNDIYIILKVGIFHSWNMSFKHKGEIGYIYYNKVKRFFPYAEIEYSSGNVRFNYTNYNIYDSNGIYYSVFDFIDFYLKDREEKYKKEINFVKRSGAVPGISKKLYKFSNYHRYPKTYNEIRQSECIDEDSVVRTRAKRNWKKLATCWWDIPRQRSKCWKDYRKTQYKGE